MRSQITWEEGVESLRREDIKSRVPLLLGRLAIFGTIRDLCRVERVREKKMMHSEGLWVFFFCSWLREKLGKRSEDRQFQWKWNYHWASDHPISRIAVFFFSSSNFFNFPNVFSKIKIQSSVFIVFVYFDRITLRAYNCISFICCGCVENFWMNFFYDFCIFYLRSFLRNPKLLLLDIYI